MLKPLCSSMAFFLAVQPLTSVAQIEVTKDFKYELGKPYTVIDAPVKEYFRVSDGVIALKVDQDYYFVQKLSGETLTQTCMKEVRDFPKGHMLEHTMVFNDRVYVFYSTWDKATQTEELWVREVDTKTCGFKDKGRSIVKVNGKLAGTLVSQGWYTAGVTDKYAFNVSYGDEHLMVKYRKKPEERDDSKNKDVIGVVVFDSTVTEVWRREYTMPYTEERMDNLDAEVDAAGNGYVLATVREKDPKELARGAEMPSHIELFRFGAVTTEIEVTPIDLGTMYISDISLFEGADNKMLCAGYFRTEKKSTGAEGMFTFSVEKSGAIGHVKRHDIPLDLINEYISERAQKKNAKKEAEGNAEVGMPNLDMTMVLVEPDGGLVLIGEQYYAVYHSASQNRSAYYTYHYDNMLVTSIGGDGTLKWMKKLPKRQITLRPPGGCSFSYFESPSHMFLLFMDHVENMDLGVNEVPKAHSDGQGGFLTGYKLDLGSGAVTKTSILDTRDVKGMELYQVGINRVVDVSATEFLMEAYKKGKEDILVRVYLKEDK
ncbi:MAG: hypothetical protein IPG74_17305 [Flavobacteriales bacterium]|nr:hypothetical protein [Flavobacteriales bacterium]